MEPNNFKKFRSLNVNYSQNLQPYYYSKIANDPVQSEMQRLDNLEQVVQLCNTEWVVDYCSKLWKNNSQQ